VKGSAVNPVLREGKLRPPRAGVGEELRPARTRTSWGAWASDSKTSVATMGHDDFRSNERSVTFAAADDLKVELVARDGSVTVLKESIPVLAGEIVDATFMSVRNLDAFLADQMAAAQAQGRAVLDTPEGHDDEGLRPDHLRPRGEDVLRRRVREARRQPSTASA